MADSAKVAMASASPYKVAQSFIKQYYKMLSNSPEQLFRFYKDHSSFTHCEGPQEVAPVVGATAIKDKVATLDLAGARVAIKDGSFDVQGSVGDGVFLMVTGEFTSRSKSPRPFVQSFFLALQPGQQNSYFVMNSVLRLLNTPAEAGASAEVLPPVLESTPALSAKPDNEADKGAGSAPVPVTEAVIEEDEVEEIDEVDEPVKVSQPLANGDVEMADDLEAEPETEIQATCAEDDIVEDLQDEQPSNAAAAWAGGSRFSFRDVLKKSLPESATVPSPAQVATVSSNSSKPAATASAPGTRPAPAKAKPADKPEGKPLRTLWISNLDPATTEAELRAVFERFGGIADLNKPNGREYAFVDFNTPAECQAALDHPEPIELQGKTLKIELKNPKRGGGKFKSEKSGGGGRGNPKKWSNGPKEGRKNEGREDREGREGRGGREGRDGRDGRDHRHSDRKDRPPRANPAKQEPNA